jgi:hypothetical protein
MTPRDKFMLLIEKTLLGIIVDMNDNAAVKKFTYFFDIF